MPCLRASLPCCRCLCKDCTQLLKDSKKELCPMCREPVEAYINIFCVLLQRHGCLLGSHPNVLLCTVPSLSSYSFCCCCKCKHGAVA